MSSATERRSLAAAFADPAPAPAPGERSAGLLEALPPRPEPDKSATAAGAPVPACAGEAADPPEAARLEAGTAEDVVRSVAVYLPPPLLARLRRAARTEDLTYADLLVRAAGNHIEVITARFTPSPARSVSGMPVRERRTRTPGVQVQLRLDGHQIAWLDQAVRRTGAPSRTALVAALLDEELPHTP